MFLLSTQQGYQYIHCQVPAFTSSPDESREIPAQATGCAQERRGHAQASPLFHREMCSSSKTGNHDSIHEKIAGNKRHLYLYLNICNARDKCLPILHWFGRIFTNFLRLLYNFSMCKWNTLFLIDCCCYWWFGRGLMYPGLTSHFLRRTDWPWTLDLPSWVLNYRCLAPCLALRHHPPQLNPQKGSKILKWKTEKKILGLTSPFR